jgi:hypothetical protein
MKRLTLISLVLGIISCLFLCVAMDNAVASEPSIITSSGSAFYQGDYSSAWYAKIRHGGAGGFRAKLNTRELFTGGTVPWQNGDGMHLNLDYNCDTGNATMTITGCLPQYAPMVMSSSVPGANGKLLITAKTSPEEVGEVIVWSVMINSNLVGPESGIEAIGSAGERDIKYLLLNSIEGSFVLDCDFIFAWGSSPKDEGPALQIDMENLPPSPSVPYWDLNGDHVCNIGDVVMIGLKWGQTGTAGWIPEDVNNDGVINIGDVVVLGLHWGETW